MQDKINVNTTTSIDKIDVEKYSFFLKIICIAASIPITNKLSQQIIIKSHHEIKEYLIVPHFQFQYFYSFILNKYLQKIVHITFHNISTSHNR